MSHKTTVGWPVYSLTFTPSDQLLIGGGGGSTKAGLKNTAGLFSISKLRMEQISEHLFGSDEDGCMCLAVHPIVPLLDTGSNICCGR